eukprot:scaffold28619_cov66-Phaeocystis_antarctica.AAC.1
MAMASEKDAQGRRGVSAGRARLHLRAEVGPSGVRKERLPVRLKILPPYTQQLRAQRHPPAAPLRRGGLGGVAPPRPGRRACAHAVRGPARGVARPALEAEVLLRVQETGRAAPPHHRRLPLGPEQLGLESPPQETRAVSGGTTETALSTCCCRVSCSTTLCTWACSLMRGTCGGRCSDGSSTTSSRALIGRSSAPDRPRQPRAGDAASTPPPPAPLAPPPPPLLLLAPASSSATSAALFSAKKARSMLSSS